jgi:hypothetical protein
MNVIARIDNSPAEAADTALIETSRWQREANPPPRFYEPVDLLRVYRTPDGVARTLHAGVYQTRDDAIDASGVVFASGASDSACGTYRIQPVSV